MSDLASETRQVGAKQRTPWFNNSGVEEQTCKRNEKGTKRNQNKNGVSDTPTCGAKSGESQREHLESSHFSPLCLVVVVVVLLMSRCFWRELHPVLN